MSELQHRKTQFLYISLILLSCSFVLAYNYYYVVEKPLLDQRINLHYQILQACAPSPYQYRILIPYISEGLTNLFMIFFSKRYAFVLSYVILNISGIFLLLWTSYRLLTIWFRKEYSLIGVLFIASVLPLTFFEHWYQPWSFWEAVFYTLALLLIVKGHKWWLAVVVFIASLNRETSILILPAFLFTRVIGNNFLQVKEWNKNNFIWLILYTFLWSVVFIGLRILRPAEAEVESLAQIFSNNINFSNILKALLNWALFIGFFWILALFGYHKAPNFLRRVVWVLLFHFPLILIWGYWREVRMLMPHYSVLVGLGLSMMPEAFLDQF